MKKLNTFLLAMFVAVGAMAQNVNITFTLNMKNETFDSANVYIAGGGTFGVPGDFKMIDPDNDSVFTITVTHPVGFSSFYTFTNGLCTDFSCKENLAGLPCGDPGNFNDRFVGPVTQDTTVQACFGQCTTDGTCDAADPPVDVTFQVNTANVTVDSMGLAGSFGGWGREPMTQVNDSIWELTKSLDPGVQWEFKYVANDSYETLDSLDGQSCVMNFGGFVNRIITVTEATSTCAYYGRCTPCAADPMVTLQVDMSNETVNAAGMFIGASWDGWSGNIAMTDMGNGVWEYTTSLGAGEYEFKFLNGGWPPTGQDELFDPATDDSLCTKTTGTYTNRVFMVGSEDVVECYEFNTCNACKPVGIRETVESLVSVRPTRVNGGMFEVAFLNFNSANYSLEVMDLMGRTMVREQLLGNTQSFEVNTSSWTKGIYLVRVGTKSQQQTVKVLVE